MVYPTFMSAWRSLLRTKSLDAILEEAKKPGRALKRTLGPIDLFSLGLGAIIGAGIFALVGTAAAGDASRPGAGPALVVSFLLTGLACLYLILGLPPSAWIRFSVCLGIGLAIYWLFGRRHSRLAPGNSK
jgi:hypothetical protein